MTTAKNNDIPVFIPEEYYDAVSSVIKTGLKHVKLDRQTRDQISAWWEAEAEFIKEELKNNPPS